MAVVFEDDKVSSKILKNFKADLKKVFKDGIILKNSW